MATWPSKLTASGLVSDTQSRVDDIIDMFNITASPTDNYILKYDAATTRFELEADSGGGGGIALTDLSVSTASASGNGALSYDNTTGVFTFTPADVSAGSSTFTDTIQAQAEVSIFCSDGGQDTGANLVGNNLTIRSTTSTFNSGTGLMNNDGSDSNLAFKCNKILLQGFANKEIQNSSNGDVAIRTKEALDGTETALILQHDEERVAVNKPLLLHTASSDPSTNLTNGLMYYNTSTNKFRGYANGSWTDLH